VLGTGSLWVSECVNTCDDVPSISVSIMEFGDELVAHETQYFADPFEAPAAGRDSPSASTHGTDLVARPMCREPEPATAYP